MKKIFTCIFCAVLAINSWGTEYEIGTGGTTSNNETVPIKIDNYTTYSITQQLYLASELTAAGASADNITGISFYYNTTNYSYTRSVEVWIMATTSNNVGTAGSDKWFKYVSTSDYSAGTKVFDGSVVLPETAGWYNIAFDNTFAWDGSENLIITVYDKTGTKASSSSRKHKVFTASAVRSLTAGGEKAYDATDTYHIKGTASTTVPVIKFTIGSDAPVVTPTLTLDKNSVNLGTLDAQYETVEQTFVVKGSNLTSDVTISAATGLQVSPSSITKEDIATAGDAGVQVTVSNTSAFTYNSPKVTVSSTGAVSKQLTVTGTVAAYSDQMTIAFMNNQTSIGGYANLTAASTKIESVDASNHSFVIGTSSTATIDYESVPGTYVANGTISGLKVKKTGEDTYKAFAFNYTAPVVTGITIDENTDNSAVLAANDGQSVTVNFTRSLTQDMYNTICLPISLSEAFVESTFGFGCSLISLASSTYEDGVITLNFEDKNELEAGKPYLVQPTKVVTNPVFNNWLVSAELHSIATTYVDFIPVMSPTVLPQSKEILFMGQNNELFWPEEAGTLKGMRCYFKVNFEGTPEGSAIAGAPVRMSIINSDGTTTDLSTMWAESNRPMIMYKNQLFIIKDSKLISISGQTIQ